MYKYIYAYNMQIYAINMHRICTEYEKNMQEICRNMQKYASICRAVSAAEICKNMQCICNAYAKTCKICNHDLHMQNMQKYAPPTLLMYKHQCTRHSSGRASGLSCPALCGGPRPTDSSNVLLCSSRVLRDRLRSGAEDSRCKPAAGAVSIQLQSGER